MAAIAPHTTNRTVLDTFALRRRGFTVSEVAFQSPFVRAAPPKLNLSVRKSTALRALTAFRLPGGILRIKAVSYTQRRR